MDNQILEAALEYAKRGWSVLPISRTKQPLIEWKTATRETLTNPDNIRSWWKQFPSANVAIVTGERSGGLVVIDLDLDEEEGKNGKEALQDWCEDHDVYAIESTATVQTGRGGQHLYFQSPFPYHNQVNCLPGVDIRGEGGCIVAPPSVHGSTRREYIWDIETDDIIVPMLDSDTAEFLGEMESKVQRDNNGPKVKNDFTKITETGGRNNQLFKYVSRLQGDGESDDDIRRYAEIYNETHLSPPLDPDEVERTINSVLSHGEWKGEKEPKQKNDLNDKHVKEYRELKTAEDLLRKNLPEPKVFVGIGEELPFLVEGTCILSAKPKYGKSWLALALCLAVVNGNDFLGYKTKQCSALYLDLETGEGLQQKRLKKALKGNPVPKNLYLDTETYRLGKGFVEQIEYYMAKDPSIGIIVVDVFQCIRTNKTNNEDSYEHAYRDITPLNQLAQKYHISIILVWHARKNVDPDDPFSNILGSTGIQGAVTQMIVMHKEKKTDPIHIFIKGKTIDGLPELNVKLENAEWSIVNGLEAANREDAEALEEYLKSDIRATIVEIINKQSKWEGKCSELINIAVQYGIGITESPKSIGYFFHRHQGRFLAEDNIKMQILPNGSGSKSYRFSKFTVGTVGNNEDSPLVDFEKVSNYKAVENIFSKKVLTVG